MRAVSLVVLAVGMVVSAARAQDAVLPERVSWELVDFVVFGDSASGVQILLSPNLSSRQGQGDNSQDLSITLDPRLLRRWALASMRIIDSVARLERRGQRPFQVTPLEGDLGKTFVTVAHDGHEPRDRPFRFIIAAKKPRTEGLQVYATVGDLRLLLTTVDAVAQHTALDTSTTSDLYLTCQLDERPRMLRAGPVNYPSRAQASGTEGRVLTQFVIDSTGRAEPASFQALMTDGEDFTTEARRAVLATRFAPGKVDGAPVRTRVWQWVRFRMH